MTDVQNKMYMKFCVTLKKMVMETYDIPESTLGEETV
jgi:hypothetical protein